MSDHLSSLRALADPAFDICDLFAFPSPERAGWLTLAMTVHPRADPATLFADDVLCQFRLRPASVAATGAQAKFAVGADDTEVAFDCSSPEFLAKLEAEERNSGVNPLEDPARYWRSANRWPDEEPS